MREPKELTLIEQGKKAVNREVQSMLEKEAILEVQVRPDQFVSTIFRPFINLKQSNQTMSYFHFKMGGHEKCDRPFYDLMVDCWTTTQR